MSYNYCQNKSTTNTCRSDQICSKYIVELTDLTEPDTITAFACVPKPRLDHGNKCDHHQDCESRNCEQFTCQYADSGGFSAIDT